MTTAETAPPIISCLCVTHRRVHMLRRAVACFLAQTWAPRELVVLHEDVDTATRDYIASLAHPLIRTVVVPAAGRLPMGTKRQLTVEAARGSHVATWDDDDWSAPTRLAEQMNGIRESGRPVCVLERWIVHDQVLGQSWLSARRPWEASMVAERSALPRYEPVDKKEDFISMEWLTTHQRVAGLRNAHLYIYVYHGTNVGSRVHFKRNIFAYAEKLSPDFSRRAAGLLADPLGPPLTVNELVAALPPGFKP